MRHRAVPLAILVGFLLPAAAAAQGATATLRQAASAACEAARGVVGKTPGITVRRRDGSFGDEMLRAPIVSCRLDINGSMKQLGKSSLPTERLSEYFAAQKWTELPSFSADGPDGTSFAYEKDGAACLVRGQWDGGSDAEPAAPRADPYTAIVICGTAADFVRPR